MRAFLTFLLLALNLIAFRAFASAELTDSCAKHLAKVEALTGQPLRFEEFYNGGLDGRTNSNAYGIPAKAKWLTATGEEVFRHYVNSKEVLKLVFETQTLRAGGRPYAEGDSKTMVLFKDLTGIYITTPEFTSAQVDGHSPLYIDFHLPKGTRYLDIIPGIMVLPGPPGKPEWVAREYAKWTLNQDSVPLYMHKLMREIDAEGMGAEPRLQKVEILGHSPL